MERLRDLYRQRNIELAVFNEVTDPVLIDASTYRIKAIDEQIKAARAALEAACCHAHVTRDKGVTTA